MISLAHYQVIGYPHFVGEENEIQRGFPKHGFRGTLGSSLRGHSRVGGVLSCCFVTHIPVSVPSAFSVDTRELSGPPALSLLPPRAPAPCRPGAATDTLQ